MSNTTPQDRAPFSMALTPPFTGPRPKGTNDIVALGVASTKSSAFGQFRPFFAAQPAGQHTSFTSQEAQPAKALAAPSVSFVLAPFPHSYSAQGRL